ERVGPRGDRVPARRHRPRGRRRVRHRLQEHRRTGTGGPAGPASLPRRVRQASLSPQLKRSAPRRNEERSQPVERDAEEVRSRMASLQRGWQRGREENATRDNTSGGAVPRETTRTDQNRPGTAKGDGR
ncbi:histidine kinase, partial [Streptomyces sp. NPDC007000]